MRILELFSGTGSVAKVAHELGYEVVSVDITDKLHTPTHLCDILKWDYSIYPVGHFDIVWASPPCRTFSTIRNTRIPKERIIPDMEAQGLPPLRRAQEIIDYFKPTRWFIENPATGRMKNYMEGVSFVDVDYCQYTDWGIRKRTRIWSNYTQFVPKLCNKQCYRYMEEKRHPLNFAEQKKRTNGDLSSRTLAERYRIPPNLIYDLIN